ncbi:MAG TPA: S66 peptidase family protein, partial [Candidatus Saccharimonadales bacterium]|nr:S66 peptidase family protein [Candidatus Saccharimonadales bacterium]
ADDINAFFKDPAIHAILSSTGGYNANSLLRLLDYESIEKNPKIFCGYSDITALNVAITAKAHLVTFNGPTVLPSFGEYGGPLPFTVEQFKHVLCDALPAGLLPSPSDFSDENLWWEKEDDRPRRMKPASPPHVIYGGRVKGVLLGGNLETLTMLGGTDYMPDFKGSILFLEEMGGSTDSIERNLTYLEQLGIFDKIAGLIYGRSYQLEDDEVRPLDTILSEFATRYGLPTVANIDCGHTGPMLTMPLGVSAELDADNGKVIITDSAVR